MHQPGSRDTILTMRQNLPDRWDSYYQTGQDFQFITVQELSRIIEHVENTQTALDLGCGTGQLCRELWCRGFNVTGIDISGEAITLAKASTAREDITFIQGNIEQLNEIKNLQDKKFDLITCKLVYAFIKDKSLFLTQVSRYLDKNGILAIITPLKEDLQPEKQDIGIKQEELEIESKSCDLKILDNFKARGTMYYVLTKTS